MSAPIQFKKATKTTARLRLALAGPSGSGKTFTALALATEIVRGTGKRIAVIDSERGSASKYAHLFDFDVVELVDGDPDTYVAAIRTAEAAGYGCVVIDSMSHAWSGKGGVLEQVDGVAAKGGSKFTAWQKGTPLQQGFIDTIIGARLHVIATMRSKTEWVLETNEKGKQAPRKIGTAPVQRDGVEYEFDVMGELDLDHTLVVTKSRCPDVDGKSFRNPGAEFANVLMTWLSLGTPAVEAPRLTVVPPTTSGTAAPKAPINAEAKAAQAARVDAVKLRIDRAKVTLGDHRVHELVGDLKGKRLVEVEQAADKLEQAIQDAAAEHASLLGDDAPFDDAPPPSDDPTPATPPEVSAAPAAPAVALTPLKAMWAAAQTAAWRSEEVTGLAHRMFGGKGPAQLDEEQLGKLTDAIEDPANAPVHDATHAHEVLSEARGVESDVRDAVAEDFAAAAVRQAEHARRGSPRARR